MQNKPLAKEEALLPQGELEGSTMLSLVFKA